jgi:general secretion pathway protein G
MRTSNRGFTLVEILIVVIILGILAAIVIPQFTSASSDARNSSTASTLQTLRSQIELFKIQHTDTPPDSAALSIVLGGKTSTADTTTTNAAATATFGPYVQNFPVNPLNGLSAVGGAAATTIGWVYVTTAGGGYGISAVNAVGGLATY